MLHLAAVSRPFFIKDELFLWEQRVHAYFIEELPPWWPIWAHLVGYFTAEVIVGPCGEFFGLFSEVVGPHPEGFGILGFDPGRLGLRSALVAQEQFEISLHYCRCQIITTHQALIRQVGHKCPWSQLGRRKWKCPRCSFWVNYNFQSFPGRMEKELRANQSLINLSSANSTNTSFCSRIDGHPLIVRRKVAPQTTSERKRRSGADTQALAVRYIPLTRMNAQENSVSLPVSRENSKENHNAEPNDYSLRKFQRHTQRVYHQYSLTKNEPEGQTCESALCLQERNALKESNLKLTSKNEKLQQENHKLLGLIQEGQEKCRKLEEQIRDKNLKLQQVNGLLAKREATCSKMHESINQKYRQISKLEDMVCKLQKQILSSSSNPQTFTPLSLESSRIINQLNAQLKYREMENHILKKEQFDAYALQEQIKTISKENNMLKDRLTYYIRKNRSIDADSCSSDSFSLSFSESSPLKRSGRLQADYQ